MSTHVRRDEDADALYVRVSNKSIARTIELSENVNVDVDGTLIGVEVIGESRWTVEQLDRVCGVPSARRRDLAHIANNNTPS